MARASRRLSARRVETIAAPGYHADGDGLYLVVDASGARRWAFIYHSHSKRREMGLGRMGLKEARDTADEVRRQIRKGIDPIASRRENRAVSAAVPTFETIAAEVIARLESEVNERQGSLPVGALAWSQVLPIHPAEANY